MNPRRLTLLGRIAIAACAPYLALKLLWVLGSDLGVVDTHGISHPTWVAVNAFTFLLDAIAALVAHTLTHPGGRRAPAWLLTFPLWMASGLLIPLVLGVVGGTLTGLIVGYQNPMNAGDFLQPWVFLIVYGGFLVEAITLLGAFAIYAHQRWGGLLRRRLHDLPDTGTRAMQRILAAPAAVLIGASGVLHLLWGSGSTLGMEAAEVHARNVVGYANHWAQGLLSLAGAVGLLLLLFPRLTPRHTPLARLRVRTPLALAWAGSAAVFACGGLLWLTMTVSDALSPGRSLAAGGLPGLAGALELFAGLVVLCAGAFTLCELVSATAKVRPDARECATAGNR
ncbi:hypothetical protein [Streptomyces piniterrae]|uniref:hypothetical protein n=1 Tax=Streptomyces piniterrae TaxID=2571125 RepID=UPI001652AB25|nr:hypothetical protein [Streptomyces piniterrae]